MLSHRVLAVGILSLALFCLGACSDSISNPDRTRPTESFFPATPPLPFTGGSAVPNYAGVWLGQIQASGCQSSFAGVCSRLSFYPHPVSILKVEFVQSNVTLTGTFGVSTFTGYVASDLGIVGRTGPDSQVRLLRSGDEFTGFTVQDVYAGPVLQRSEKFDVTNLRRAQ